MTTASSGNPGKRKPRPAVTRATARVVDATSVAATQPIQPIQPEQRYAMICDVAYFLSERRGFCPGQELDDWLTAEAEVDRALTLGIPVNHQGG